MATTPSVCNTKHKIRFFRYSVTAPRVNDDLRNLHLLLTLQDFDINTNEVPALKTWLESSIQLGPNLSGYTVQVIFENVPVNRLPNVGFTIDLPFRIQLDIDLTNDVDIVLTFS